MELVFEGQSDQICVRVLGEIVAMNSAELTQGVLEASVRRPPRLILNLAGATFLDTAGMSALLSLRVEMETRGTKLIIAEPSPPVFRVLQTARLLKIFRIEEAEFPV